MNRRDDMYIQFNTSKSITENRQMYLTQKNANPCFKQSSTSQVVLKDEQIPKEIQWKTKQVLDYTRNILTLGLVGS